MSLTAFKDLLMCNQREPSVCESAADLSCRGGSLILLIQVQKTQTVVRLQYATLFFPSNKWITFGQMRLKLVLQEDATWCVSSRELLSSYHLVYIKFQKQTDCPLLCKKIWAKFKVHPQISQNDTGLDVTPMAGRSLLVSSFFLSRITICFCCCSRKNWSLLSYKAPSYLMSVYFLTLLGGQLAHSADKTSGKKSRWEQTSAEHLLHRSRLHLFVISAGK